MVGFTQSRQGVVATGPRRQEWRWKISIGAQDRSSERIAPHIGTHPDSFHEDAAAAGDHGASGICKRGIK